MQQQKDHICRDWYAFLNTHRPNDGVSWDHVERAVLSHGGESVVRGYALDVERAHLVERGCLRDSDEVTRRTLDQSECHFNSARVWMSKYDDNGGWEGDAGGWHIVTGYGLSDDGIWREHTWVENDAGTIVETTVPREKYYGVQLENHVEARSFCTGEGVYPVSD